MNEIIQAPATSAKSKLAVLDLFSGIGGFSLGLERTGGFETVAFCEINPFARRVLAKHWPKVPCYDDVRTLDAARLDADGVFSPDVICGGFPCQDISLAGAGAGLAGERSGLWSEIARLTGELRPRYVLVENVAALLGRGLDTVLGDLAALGYDAEWHCIPASAVGAPHRRDRIWIVAYPDPAEWRAHAASCGRVAREVSVPQGQEGPSGFGASREDVPDATGQRWGEECQDAARGRTRNQQEGSCRGRFGIGGSDVADANGVRQPQSQGIVANVWGWARDSSWWSTEPDVGRVAHGVPARVDRLRSLGNAVVPQIPEMIGRAILAAEASVREAA